MKNLLKGRGFLGTAAPRAADVVLVLEIGMGAALLVGAALARRRRFRAHALCQSVVVLLNLAAVVGYMWPSYRLQVSPLLRTQPSSFFSLIATVHGILGGVTEIAGLYTLLSAGTNVLPERLRIAAYKPWMRGLLALWWIVLILGVMTYARWYAFP